jgi:hypothetical protein
MEPEAFCVRESARATRSLTARWPRSLPQNCSNVRISMRAKLICSQPRGPVTGPRLVVQLTTIPGSRHQHLTDYEHMPVVPNGVSDAFMDVTENGGEGLRLQMEFDDDNGCRWRKYESLEEPLRRIR